MALEKVMKMQCEYMGANMLNLDNAKVLLTGGTGSLGNALVEHISKMYVAPRFPRPKKVIIFSRDEYKQSLMQKEYSYPWLRFFLGDVRDLTRLNQVCRDVDIVIHAAALKQIPMLEYNPIEAIRTNIDGTVNVIEACISNDVEKCVFISTDKAVAPVNLYGATKMAAEKLVLAANNYNKTKFSCVRYGNVLNSRGSVVEHFLKLKREGVKVFPITHLGMTRFWITLEEACELVMTALNDVGSLIVPRLPSMKIANLAKAIDPECEFELIGIRPGEKLHESLEIGYSSDTNDVWLTRKELRRKIGL